MNSDLKKSETKLSASDRKEQPQRRKKIAIIATGGTIAGTGRPGKAGAYKAGELPVSSILASIPHADQLADLELIDICAIDSNDITMDHYASIKSHVEAMNADPEIDGIVITTGTDTMEESAFLLNLTLDVCKPVIITGAMRPATAVSADGPMNLYQAIALACHPHASRLGVVSVLSNTIYSGRDLEKSNSIKTDAFRPGGFGALGYMQDDHVHILQMPYGPHTYKSPYVSVDLKHLPRVEIFYIHQQADPELLDYMVHTYDGVIIAGTGSGNYSKDIQRVIENAPEECMIVRSSRLPDGVVFDSSEFDPNQRTIPAYRLSPHKSRLLLMLAGSVSRDPEFIRTCFENC